MNYRHAYHAGNFSDVIKHVVLISLLTALAKKQKPFAYFDTHAGSGIYQLGSEESQKTAEYKNGIEKLKAYISNFDLEEELFKKNAEKIPDSVRTYFNIIHQLTPDLHEYPGSVLFAHTLLNASNSLIACEMHPEEASKLKQHIKLKEKCRRNLEMDPSVKPCPKVAIHQQDGYLGLKSFLPFKEKRGLILIDPPFEKNTEWTDLVNNLKSAYCRFPQGIYAIWYPIKDQNAVRNFLKRMVQQFSGHESLGAQSPGQILNVECVLDKAYGCMSTRIARTGYSNALMGTGMLILNPPWKIEDELAVSINWLWSKLQFNEKGACSVQWLSQDHF